MSHEASTCYLSKGFYSTNIHCPFIRIFLPFEYLIHCCIQTFCVPHIGSVGNSLAVAVLSSSRCRQVGWRRTNRAARSLARPRRASSSFHTSWPPPPPPWARQRAAAAGKTRLSFSYSARSLPPPSCLPRIHLSLRGKKSSSCNAAAVEERAASSGDNECLFRRIARLFPSCQRVTFVALHRG